MKTVLDLLREFGTLNEAKLKRGKLRPKSEERWAELKEFYDRLMEQNAISGGMVTQRFGAAEIRAGVPRRKHLRVPVSMDIMFEHEGQYHSGTILNLSCSGVFLASDTIIEVDSRLTLYLANIGRGADAMMVMEGEVAWTTKADESRRTQGMGIRFVNVPETSQRQLDSVVLETLEKHLCGLSSNLLDPEFLERENLKL